MHKIIPREIKPHQTCLLYEESDIWTYFPRKIFGESCEHSNITADPDQYWVLQMYFVQVLLAQASLHHTALREEPENSICQTDNWS